MSAGVGRSGYGELRVSTEDRTSAIVLRVDGELDLAGAPRLTAAVEATRERPNGVPLVIDLSGVAFMDSTGVRSLVDAGRTASEDGRRLAFLRPSPQVTRVLDLVDLRRAFAEIEDLDDGSLAQARLPQV
jgi:anti-anti-sigma factor